VLKYLWFKNSNSGNFLESEKKSKLWKSVRTNNWNFDQIKKLQKEFLLKQTWSILASSLWTDLGKNAEKRSLEVVTTSPLPQKIWRSWNRRSDIRGRSRSRRSEVVVVKLLMIKQYLVLLTLIRISFLHECDYVNWSWNEKAVTYVNLMIM